MFFGGVKNGKTGERICALPSPVPNDVCVRSDGSIYFSDPWYGRMEGFGEPRDRVLGFQSVFRIPANGGELELVVERGRYDQPNGLCFSPDESLLYINDSTNALIDVYDVREDGSLSNRRNFAKGIGTGEIEGGVPDGMKCDELENIWVTGPQGISKIPFRARIWQASAVPRNAQSGEQQ